MSIRIKVKTSGLDNFDLGKMTDQVICPECQASNTVTLDQMKREDTITCAGCNKTIKLVDKDTGVDKTVSSVNNAMSDLKKTLDNLGR